jgi:transposase
MLKLDPKWMETSESLFQRGLIVKSVRLRERYLALALIASGRTIKQVAAQVGKRRQTLAEWVERYNAYGIDGIKPEFKSNRAPFLDEDQFLELIKALDQSPIQSGIPSTRWRGADVALWIEERWDIKIHPETARRYMIRAKRVSESRREKSAD